MAVKGPQRAAAHLLLLHLLHGASHEIARLQAAQLVTNGRLTVLAAGSFARHQAQRQSLVRTVDRLNTHLHDLHDVVHAIVR